MQLRPLGLGIVLGPLAISALVAELFSARARRNTLPILAGRIPDITTGLAGSYGLAVVVVFAVLQLGKGVQGLP